MARCDGFFRAVCMLFGLERLGSICAQVTASKDISFRTAIPPILWHLQSHCLSQRCIGENLCRWLSVCELTLVMALVPTEKSQRIKWIAFDSSGNSVSSESLSLCNVSIALISSDLHNIFSLVEHVAEQGSAQFR